MIFGSLMMAIAVTISVIAANGVRKNNENSLALYNYKSN